MTKADPFETDYQKPPAHYAGSVTPWDYIKAQGLDYWTGNVLKYITRAGRKGTGASVRLHDLIKARNFLNFAIKDEREHLARTTGESVAAQATKYSPTKDYSFTVTVPVHLPEGSLSREDQAEIQRQASMAAEDAAKSHVRRMAWKGTL